MSDAWSAIDRGAGMEADWQKTLVRLQSARIRISLRNSSGGCKGELPSEDWAAFADKAIAEIDAAGADMATRKASLVALNAFYTGVAGNGRRLC